MFSFKRKSVKSSSSSSSPSSSPSVKNLRKSRRITEKINTKKPLPESSGSNSFYTPKEEDEYYTPDQGESPEDSPNTKLKKVKNASKTIKNFMKSSFRSGKITNAFLKKVCTDSGACMVFGKELDTIRRYFNGFTGFEYVEHKKRVGAVSNNGFVIELKNKRDGYFAHTILKSAINPDSDNLAYEYYVGIHFINIICKRFPCFLETYGLYYYKNEGSWNTAKTYPNKINLLTDLEFEKETKVDFGKACEKSKYIAILIQHVYKPITLQSLLESNKISNFINFELVYILLQVYYPLAYLQDHFTHYDLHMSNVLIYTLPNGECVEYSFIDYETGKRMTFKTQYLVKIIDYGRSYFRRSSTIHSREVYDKVCGHEKCQTKIERPNKPPLITSKCGSEFGFELFNIKDFYHIDSMKRNRSHDLRLFIDIIYYYYDYVSLRTKSEYGKMITSKHSLYRVCDDLIYDESYGTPELKSDPRDTKIRNVGDLYKRLLAIVNEPNYIGWNNTKFNSMTCVCKFNIKGNENMVVTP
jgi:hypothetical protein